MPKLSGETFGLSAHAAAAPVRPHRYAFIYRHVLLMNRRLPQSIPPHQSLQNHIDLVLEDSQENEMHLQRNPIRDQYGYRESSCRTGPCKFTDMDMDMDNSHG
jgi:hypothetical protein